MECVIIELLFKIKYDYLVFKYYMGKEICFYYLYLNEYIFYMMYLKYVLLIENIKFLKRIIIVFEKIYRFYLFFDL